MFFSKKDKARIPKDPDELDEEELEDELEEIEEDTEDAAAPDKPDSEETAPSAESGVAGDDEADDDDDEYDDDEEEDEHNDADDEEERYLLSLARRQKWKKYTAVIIAGVVVVAAISILLVRALTHVDPGRTAAKVGDSEISLAEFAFNYFYGVDYCGNQYQSYGIDLTGDLKKTACAFDSSITWHDYFVKSAAELLQQNVALYTEATNAGYSVTD